MRNRLILNYPASIWSARWKDALPAGNGSIGAAVYGGCCEETVMLTHENLWWQGTDDPVPDVSGRLPEVRRLLAERRAPEADKVLADALKERGYNPRVACPLPLGDLKWIVRAERAFADYSRTLDMETGLVTVAWADGDTRLKRELFVSRADDAVVCRLTADGPLRLGGVVWLDLHDIADARMPFGGVSALPTDAESFGEGAFVYYAARKDDGTDFGAVALVRAEGGELSPREKGLAYEGAASIQVVAKVFYDGDRSEAWPRLAAELADEASAQLGFSALLERHAALHAPIFNRMTLDLHADEAERSLSNEELLLRAYKGQAPVAMLEKMWAYGRYLLVSSSREGGNPSPLMGLWSGEYTGFWAFNMINENLQMNYWQALSGNMPETLLAVFDYFERLLDDFRENAARLYGCRGIYIPAPTSPQSGRIGIIYPHIIHWTGGAGWIAQHYYDYYLHTGDISFLRERALPFLMETATFYRDFFTIGEDGFYVSSPSNSPENTPGNYWSKLATGCEETTMETTINATMDFAIAKEVLTHLAEGMRIAGGYDEAEIAGWEAMLARIPPYQINADGAVREWMHPDFDDNYEHRHQSHVYPLFPGTEVTKEREPALFEAFVTAIRKRLVIGLKQQSGWSLAHMANSYARTGEGDLALESLDILARSCVLSNFFTVHNDWRGMGIGVDLEWAPFQIDANMGWTAALQEMLLFGVPGRLSLLPALPTRLSRGAAGPLLARGAIEASLEWDAEAGRLRAKLTAKAADADVAVTVPARFVPAGAPTEYRITLQRGQPITLAFTASEGVLAE
ncbi:glycosyl hydrolase family 95 catalytic domain-containing protein [Cohnella fermenti]|uniref:Glycoside hydrolase family 95 protein n=1 Tax=Cohnella fermenti TaxID=2565925 RepID=A0A4S4BKI8_9BACL|nr:glycoside hydrolase N-terminal domain-containing protein [Cohnella fermenti]THF75252.1 glycoside hydrolase family 95 protein [Cohnella fermenti]